MPVPDPSRRATTIEIETTELEALETAVVRRRYQTDEGVRSWISTGLGVVVAHLQTIGVATAGPPFARFHPASSGEGGEVEAGFPVVERITPKDEVSPSTLPGGLAATTSFDGPPSDAGTAYDAVAAWIEQQGVSADGPPWEHYEGDPVAGPNEASRSILIVQPYAP